MCSTRHRRRALIAIVLLTTGIVLWRSLPSPLFTQPLSTIVLARDGALLGARIAADGQWRFPAVEQVPNKFRIALIAFEDKRFERHPGVDPLALARAIYLNLEQGRIVSGGSTLSMQTIRLARGQHAPGERGYGEKIIEMGLALRLEMQYNKREILALYAAHAPFGGNVVGLEAAAWRYFGRDPQQLSWAEICTLAVLPNSPSLIHPGKNRAKLLEKRNGLLRRLQAAEQISALDLTLALQEPLPQQPLPLPQHAPHLLETLRASAPGTHRFRTTLDATLQRAANEVVRARAQDLARQDIHNAAALIVDNRSFEVLAYVGNPDYSMNNERGYAVDIVRRPRSSGSILKPLLFAAMLDAGEILPGTLVADVPTQYGGYTPENYDHRYRGAVPAEVALAQSLNVPAVRMLKRHGVHRFYDFLKQFGMTSLARSADDYGLSLILGGAEVSLWEVAHFYANLANLAQPAPEETVRVYRPLRVWEQQKIGTPVASDITPGAAWLTLHALIEVARPGEEGYWKNFASTRKIAWKTGTSWGLRDAWAAGSTTRHTVAVWAGNASGEGRPGLTGSAVAAPILFDLFGYVGSANWFSPPELHLKKIEVCKNDGYLANGHCGIEQQWMPRDSHFDQISPHHLRVHLDRARRVRVHSGCERIAAMESVDWFVLPPAQEFYYRQHHSDYRMLPAYRNDCGTAADTNSTGSTKARLDFLYPNQGARIYIPTDLAEKKGRTVFEAVHRERDALIHWHLDELYLGSTRTFHQRALDAAPGAHVITIVDQEGNQQSRHFEVLNAK